VKTCDGKGGASARERWAVFRRLAQRQQQEPQDQPVAGEVFAGHFKQLFGKESQEQLSI
jgi:hypothetical protein